MELVLLRCLLLILLSCLVCSATPASGDVVFDTAGHPVVSGFPYYIRAAQARNGGNLGWASLNNSCPLNVLLKPFPYGQPVMFFPEEEGARQNKSVLLTEKLSVMFAAPSPCDASTLWRLDRTRSFVTTGGVLVPPSSEYSYSRFRIVRYPFPGDNVYQLMYCPEESLLCSTVGIAYGSQTLLGDSSEPIALKFIKLTEAS